MLNMREEAGGRGLSMLAQVALEEESGKATNGLGFAVVDRGPAELWDIATPAQRERFVGPVLRGEYREAWALTEPGAGSTLWVSAAAAGAGLGPERREVVRDEPEIGFCLVLAARGEQTSRGRGRGLGQARTWLSTTYLDHHPDRPARQLCERVPASGTKGEWFLVERLFIAARCCGRRAGREPAACAQGRASAPIAESRVSFPSPTR
jgi:hypothetical protein